MLSGWELGRHVTSIGHRAMLCEIFGQPPDALFAHQDEQLASGSAALRLLAGWDAVQSAMLATVAGARECLVVTGSRSRDRGYLEAIEAVLAERPSLVYYRVLFGPPHHQVLKDHLLELLRLEPGRQDAARGHGGGRGGGAGAVLLRQRADGGDPDPVADVA